MSIFDRPATDLDWLKKKDTSPLHRLHRYSYDKKYLEGVVAAAKGIREFESVKRESVTNENTKEN